MKRFSLPYAVLAVLSTLHADAATVSSFDSNAESWTAVTADFSAASVPVVNVPGITWQTPGGNPDGMIRVNDIDDYDTMFVAPATFLGDRLSAYNANLTFDLFAFNNPNYGGPLVVLKGGGMTLTYTAASMTLVQDTWVSMIVPLVANSNWHVGNQLGGAPSAAQFQGVLSNLTALWISAENVGGIVESTGLDNVSLADSGGVNPVPEPESMLTAAFSILLIGVPAARRRDR